MKPLRTASAAVTVKGPREKTFRFAQVAAFVLTVALCWITTSEAFAHGERMQQPSLRMRTIQWLDVTWTRADGRTDGPIKVNDEITIKGKMLLPNDKLWPSDGVKPPAPSYLQTAGPASVFVKKATYIGEIPVPASMDLTLGKTYEFTMVMQARVPGLWHLHPALQVTGTGPVIGPGKFFDVQGAWSDFVWSAKAGRDGRVAIDNIETWQVGNIVGWHAVWFGVAIAWVLWWARRPMLIPRFRALREGHADLLLNRSDSVFAIILAGVIVGAIVYGQFVAWSKYPDVIPLQTSLTPVDAMAEEEDTVQIRVKQGEFNIPNRAMKAQLEITNTGTSPVWVSEFETAGLRFMQADNAGLPPIVVSASDATTDTYPSEYLLKGALTVSPQRAIQPGETVVVDVVATDAAWEVEGLSQVVHSPVRRFGGVIWTYDETGKRHRNYLDYTVRVTYGAGA